jgi:hypothetical protein
VRFNNSYGIRHFCDEQALNSLHFLTALRQGFCVQLLLFGPPKDSARRLQFKLANEGTRPPQQYLGNEIQDTIVHNGAGSLQGLLEGLTWSTRRASGQDPRPDVAVERTDPSRRPETETEMDPRGTSPPGEVTSRAITCAVGTSSSCAPAGQLRCQPASSTGSACSGTDRVGCSLRGLIALWSHRQESGGWQPPRTRSMLSI